MCLCEWDVLRYGTVKEARERERERCCSEIFDVLRQEDPAPDTPFTIHLCCVLAAGVDSPPLLQQSRATLKSLAAAYQGHRETGSPKCDGVVTVVQ